MWRNPSWIPPGDLEEFHRLNLVTETSKAKPHGGHI